MTSPPAPVFETVEVGRDGAVGHVTLARPDRLNALSPTVLRELVVAARWLDGQPAVRAVVVSGAGRAFSAGFDLGDFGAAGEQASALELADLGRLMVDAVAGMRSITLAAVHGHCVGGGVLLALACDLRIAAADARFSIPEVDLGIPLGWGGIPRLVREVGPAVTKDLVLTGRRFDAGEAHGLGLVQRVVPVDRLGGESAELAAALAAKPAGVLRATKQQVDAAAELLVSTRGAFTDAALLVECLRDPEAREAARRYLEARTGRE